MTEQERQILYICTEDWFFHSHFLPLNMAAVTMRVKYKTTLISNTSAMREGLEKLGIRVLPFDFNRRSINPYLALKQFWFLSKQVRQKKPDIIHFIALKPILIGGLAGLLMPKAAKIYHVTGLGSIAEGRSWFSIVFRTFAFKLLIFYLKRSHSYLIIENPDDLKYLMNYGSIPRGRVSLFGGAGVDPDIWPNMPTPTNDVPRVAFVGRLIWTKGVDILVKAMEILYAKGVQLELDLYGEPDYGNPKTVHLSTLLDWSQLPNVTWHGRTKNVKSVWKHADISVVPTRTREGMPRAMLEAASCGRPQVVTNVPGPKHFVRDGIEGIIVPPENPQALADALERLASNKDLRMRMGNAARQRIINGFTEAHVCEKTKKIYRYFHDMKEPNGNQSIV